jgi:hypothetical protein
VRALLSVALILLASPAVAQTQTALPSSKWFKGNTHTHTLNSDGDSSPGEVAHWYRDKDYDFLVLSDHNYFTEIDVLQREMDGENLRMARKPFLLIPGEEATSEAGPAAIHVNGLDTKRLVGEQKGASKHEVLQKSVDAILAAGGVPSVNHPNYLWSIGADDLAALRGLRHFEIYNGHPGVHNFGGGGRPGLEAMWDDLLTCGVRLFGLAVDDTHDFKAWSSRHCNPGRGWIMVRSRYLTREAIRRAFETGEFYASTGVTLDNVWCLGKTVRVRIRPEADEATLYTTTFIGDGGRILAQETGLESSYAFTPRDRYVRVRVMSSIAEYAWSQPFFADPEPAPPK